jgi:hypothetical protein
MKYSKPITIDGWQQIAERYAPWVKDGLTLHSKLVPKEDFPWIESIICPALKKITGIDHKILASINFFVAPGVSRGIHVDYSDPKWPTKGNWALNIPILNYENSKMLWYTGDYTQETYHRPGGYISEKLTWKSKPVLLEAFCIKEPTLVYVDIPHDVRNNGTEPRVFMSLRMTPNILTLDPHALVDNINI